MSAAAAHLAALVLPALHWLAGLVVLAEALNKLERTAPLARGLAPRARVVAALKALAWALLAVGAGGAVGGPFVGAPPPALGETCAITGFAVLIIRTRIKEG